MKAGLKAVYSVELTDGNSLEVSFESVESRAFSYGNRTSVFMSSDKMEQKRCFDTRYYVGSFDECCKDIIDEHFGDLVKSISKLS